jgi:O-acetyl-ADP-ribose deacetylase (regulator of RNase III)
MISATAGFGQRRGAAAASGGVIASLSVLPGRLVGVPVITAVLGDITKQEVDAIVNAANKAMRGGGGVGGAIHRNGGPAILHDCIERFPKGLATGDAGWTTASDLPVQWVIHTVGPNYNAAQRDRSLLTSCYRRALEVADELSAQSVAFPLISTGASGWPAT